MNVNNETALLYGILLGDGCLSKHINKKGNIFYFISISGNYYEDKPFYRSIVVPLINSLRIDKKPIKFRDRKDYGKIEVNFSDKLLFNQLKNLGFPVGKKGSKLKIPKIFYDKGLIKYLVQGYFATDGSLILTKNPNKFYPRLEVHGIAPKLIMQVKDYLMKIGLKGHFYECKRDKKNIKWKNVQVQYRLQFNGDKNLKLFQDKIGFVNSKQFDKFSNFLRYSKEYDDKIKKIPTQKQRFFRNKVKL